MKKTTITTVFETEKFEALSYYAGKKDISITDELQDTLQKLYEKHVPPPTREYIEDRLAKEEKSVKPKRTDDKPKTAEKPDNNSFFSANTTGRIE